ncbi:Nif3-like dinuclear metal center hexameric protein [Fusibacter tunisiensis]|uniref:GTP cyclohydrolase 1 type 2 homolog n=1 Tax=Fusibacter tunisiensis TaxID=1008308 RepID=A0ABS2MMR6_9FIRM|nr:Nif3-like dinuclear metal center hexameric protein [Fusibacter tunisiensis]MBM7560694.1 dinuclear metal center YbgI/SA1388 family protein [Fusibacter tunisiensis]
MITSVNQIMKLIQKLAPFETADDWDNVGLIIGSGSHIVNRILIALDLTETVLDEAVEEGYELIITHHPPIFSAIKNITTEDRLGRLIIKAIQNDISVVSAHTNLDKSFNFGINHFIADAYGLEQLRILIPEGENVGHGVIGTFKTPMDFDAFINLTKKIFNIDLVKGSNFHKKRAIRSLAIASGAASDFIENALTEKADIFLTSDLKYHEYQRVIGTDLALLDIGHFESERVYLEKFCDLLMQNAHAQNYDVVFQATETEMPLIKHL